MMYVHTLFKYRCMIKNTNQRTHLWISRIGTTIDGVQRSVENNYNITNWEGMMNVSWIFIFWVHHMRSSHSKTFIFIHKMSYGPTNFFRFVHNLVSMDIMLDICHQVNWLAITWCLVKSAHCPSFNTCW